MNHTPGVYIFVQSPPVTSVLGHVTCFNQLYIHQCDASRGLMFAHCDLLPWNMLEKLYKEQKYPEQKSQWTTRHVNESTMDHVYPLDPLRREQGGDD